MLEEWREIKGYEGYYEVSNYGRVRSVTRTIRYKSGHLRVINGQGIKLIKKNTGYMQVNLNINSKAKPALVHRLVANAFIENPMNKPQVNHIDGNGQNNSVLNLEWVTSSENSLHAYRVLGNIPWTRGKLGKGLPMSKAVKQISLDGNIVKVWDCVSDAVREHGFDSGCISRAATGIYKSHKGYRWEYL